MALPEKHRLRKTKEIELVFKKGSTVKGNLFLIKYYQGQRPSMRAAIVVSSRVSSLATQRNKIKRTISAALLPFLKRSVRPLDVVIVASPRIKEKNFSEIAHSLGEMFRKANIV